MLNLAETMPRARRRDLPRVFTARLSREVMMPELDRTPGSGSKAVSATNDPAIRRMTTTPYPYLVFYEATENEISRDSLNWPAATRTGWGSRHSLDAPIGP